MREVDLLLVLVPLEHREIDDPGELEPVLVDELELLPHFRAREPREFGELVRIARDEERRVARLEPELNADRLGSLRADVVGDRTAPAHSARLRVGRERRLVAGAVEEQDVAEARLALALRPGVHPVGEGALAAARRRDRPDLVLRRLQEPREDLEPRAAEALGDILHDDRVAQVRLVGAVFAHGLGVGDARPGRGRHRLAAGEFLEHAADDRLHRREHVLLLDEAHLDVELVEFARQAVGARVLVAEAGRDLEIAVEARHHQELLVLLRRLRQRVELARMQARGHEKVARALGARCGQDRRLELEEALPPSSARAANR